MRVAWLALFALVGSAVGAHADFAATQGFSGKHGVTCESCHVVPSPSTDPPAVARLEGLPPAWDHATPVTLTIGVEGGPMQNPVPGQPRGGFDLETDLGTLAPGPGMDGLLRFPNPTEATYTGAGTARRTWTVVWTPPNASEPPRDARFWLAVVAANGNHVLGGRDTFGERGDQTAKLERSVPPSEAANQTWFSQPLPAPVLDPLRPGAAYVSGRVAEFADGALWRLDGGEWLAAVGAPSFVIQLPILPRGAHRLDAVAVWLDRTSEPASIQIEGGPGGASVAARPSESPGAGLFLVLSCVLSAILIRGVKR